MLGGFCFWSFICKGKRKKMDPNYVTIGKIVSNDIRKAIPLKLLIVWKRDNGVKEAKETSVIVYTFLVISDKIFKLLTKKNCLNTKLYITNPWIL